MQQPSAAPGPPARPQRPVTCARAFLAAASAGCYLPRMTGVLLAVAVVVVADSGQPNPPPLHDDTSDRTTATNNDHAAEGADVARPLDGVFDDDRWPLPSGPSLPAATAPPPPSSTAPSSGTLPLPEPSSPSPPPAPPSDGRAPLVVDASPWILCSGLGAAMVGGALGGGVCGAIGTVAGAALGGAAGAWAGYALVPPIVLAGTGVGANVWAALTLGVVGVVVGGGAGVVVGVVSGAALGAVAAGTLGAGVAEAVRPRLMAGLPSPRTIPRVASTTSAPRSTMAW